MATPLDYPPLPEGFVLDKPSSSDLPPLPEGFVLDESTTVPFEEFGEMIEKKPSFKEELGRHTARTGARIGEALIGLPGDIGRLLQTGAEAVGTQAVKVREKTGLSPLKVTTAPPGVPGSQELKELSTKIFGKTVLPQTPREAFIDDIVGDAAVLAIPVKGKIPFIRSIGTAIAANLGAKVAEKLGLGEKGQAVAKLGTFFLAGLTGRGSVKKYWNQQYKLAQEAIPTDTRISTGNLNKKLRIFERENLLKGGPTAAKKKVREFFDDLSKKSERGSIEVDELLQFKHDINQNRSGLYGKELSRTELKVAKRYYNELASGIEDSIQSYGKKNPDFLKHWTNAQESFAGFQQSKRVGNWISRAIPFGKLGKGGLLILEALFKPATLKATLPGIAILKSGEILTRMLKNPTLRRFYGNLMKDAVKENAAGVVKNIRAMEKEIEKSDPDIFDELFQS